MVTRTDIINYLITMTGANYYLEVGSEHRIAFDEIKCLVKHDVEPRPGPGIEPTYKMESDEAFSIMDTNYDIIFLDGLHLCEQVAKDVYNACQHLNSHGFIVIHDCLPEKEIEQARTFNGGSWTGDAWKFQAWMVKRYERVWTIPENWGCGIIWGPLLKNRVKPTLQEMSLVSKSDPFRVQDFEKEQALIVDWSRYIRNWPWMLRVVDWESFKKIIAILWADSGFSINL